MSKLKIVSWNASLYNNSFENFNDLLTNYCPKIVCLQEVSESLLENLSNLKEFEIFHVKEGEYFFKKKFNFYLVILVKKKFKYLGMKTFNSFERSKRGLFIEKFFLQKVKIINNYFYLDLVIDNLIFRIINCHLPLLTSSKKRFGYFKAISLVFDSSKNNIICGDFNILDSFIFRYFLSFFFGTSFKDIFYFNERLEFENLFLEFDLKNIFRFSKTFKNNLIYSLQLDHILFTKKSFLIHKDVISNLCGSDHKPLFVYYSLNDE